MESDEEIEAYGYESLPEDDDDEGALEYGGFEEAPEEEFQMGYKQLEHVGYGDVEAMGLTIAGGKYEKMQKLLMYETVSKEKQYVNSKFRPSLLKYFGENYDLVNNYMISITKVPRFFLKNSDALAAAIYTMHHNKTGITNDILKNYSKKTQINEADLYRYYKLIKKYI